MIQYFMDGVTKHYFDFNGRTRRTAFWYYMLVYVVIYIVLAIVQSVAHMTTPIITSIFALALLLPTLGMEVRRLHDTNRSGWWVLIALVPLIGIILLIVWWAAAGTTGSNEYGPDPKAAG
jgi:uncharacterized membrane protein YhaH (DUF805 family)